MRTQLRGVQARWANSRSYFAIILLCAALASGIPAVAQNPTVANVSSATANGTYGVGSAISITMKFSSAMVVTDYNDDGIVNSVDTADVNLQTARPYNLFADLNGDGVINTNDVRLARSMLGATLP